MVGKALWGQWLARAASGAHEATLLTSMDQEAAGAGG